MDPLSIATGVLTLTKLSVEILNSLSNARSKLKSASSDCARLQDEVSALHIILQRLEELLDTDLKHDDRLATSLSKYLSPCQTTLEAINAKLQTYTCTAPGKLHRLKGKMSFVAGKGSLRDYATELSSHKSGIILLLQLHNMYGRHTATKLALTDLTVTEKYQSPPRSAQHKSKH
jgi:Fungal N-terminal domain of STAND proteins